MWGHDEKFLMQKQSNFKIYIEILVSKPFHCIYVCYSSGVMWLNENVFLTESTAKWFQTQ